MLPVLHVQISRHSRGFAYHLSLALPHLATTNSLSKIVAVHVTSSAIFLVAAACLKSAIANGLATASDSLQGIPLLLSDGDSLQRIPSLQSDKDSLQGIPSLQSDKDSLQGIPSLQSDKDSLQGIPSLPSGSDSLQRIPPLQSDSDSLQGILIHLSVNTHLVPLLVMVLLRGPHRGLLLPVHLHLLGRIRKLRSLLFQPQSEL